jgi:hypothetical protein
MIRIGCEVRNRIEFIELISRLRKKLVGVFCDSYCLGSKKISNIEQGIMKAKVFSAILEKWKIKVQ